MTIRIYKPEARAALAERLKVQDLIITDRGELYMVNFSDRRVTGGGGAHSYVVVAAAVYIDGQWWKTAPLTQIAPLFATADTKEEAVDFAETVKELYETKQTEIDRLEQQFLISVRMIADEIVS